MKSLYFLILFFVIFANSSFAQNESVKEKISEFNQDKVETIALIKKSLAETKNSIIQKENEIRLNKDKKEKLILENDLTRLKERYGKIKLNLVSVITDIKIDEIKNPEENHKRDLLQEAQELLGPAIDSIQRISAKPRKIEALNKELSSLQEKITLTDIALNNIETVTKSSDFKALVPDIGSYIEEAKFNVNDLRQELIIKFERVNRDLLDLTKDDESMLDATTAIVRDFFSKKGKNLIISTITFFLTIFFISRMRKRILLPLVEKNPDIVFYKTLNAMYGIICFFSAFGVAILTLYLLGDWVLVTFSVLVIAGSIWAFKDYLRKLAEEGRLILNLGSVKEGDLIVFNNLSWKVKNISFITTFENPYLDTPILKVEISKILKMHSRKIISNEPWFPSKSGDWVLLSDGTFGEVKIQTVEQIVLMIGESQLKYFLVPQYLELHPINLSQGFTIDFIWGFDYEMQSEFLTYLIPKIETLMNQLLEHYPQKPLKFNIDFHSAGASTLNLNIVAIFSGNHARLRFKILKDLQKMLLEICNNEKFKIPFNQLVIHLPDRDVLTELKK